MSSENKNSMRFIRYPIGALVGSAPDTKEIEGADVQEAQVSLFLCRPYSQKSSRQEQNVCDQRYV